VENVTDRVSNPFGMDPPCERYVPGYGDANADFHVVGDHPGVHGGLEAATRAPSDPAPSPADGPPTRPPSAEEGSGVPFTNEAGRRLQRALVEAGLLERAGDRPLVNRTYLSYLHMCAPAGDGAPPASSYADLERFFDAELRAIAAHVLIPVGERAVRHVLANYTAREVDPATDLGLETLHGREIHGSGWLVVPVVDPADWTADGDHADRLVAGLRELQRTDFRRESDLGRFFPGDRSYLVR
jgi:uracil-DNA glycosylase